MINSWRGFLIICLALVLFAILEGNLLDYLQIFNSCSIDRYHSSFKEDKTSSIISSSIFNFTQICLLVLFLDIILFQHSHKSRHENGGHHAIIRSQSILSRFNLNERSFFLVSFGIVWWLSTYAIVYALKVWLKDTQCHGSTPNSVSGHFAFHVYFFLMAIYTMVQLKRDPRPISHYFTLKPFFQAKSAKTKRMLITYGLFLASSIFTLTRTWFLGYHSGRQIFYGTLAAILSHFIMTYVLEHYSDKLLVVFCSFASISMIFVWILTSKIPFDFIELLVFAGCFVIAILTYKVDHWKIQ